MAEKNGDKHGHKNGADNGDEYGDGYGEVTAEVRSKNGGRALDFDAFVLEASQHLSDLAPTVFVTRSRFRVGEIALEPLESLEARCRAKWRGRRVTLMLRVKGLDGKIALQGELPIDEPEDVPASPASSSTSAEGAAVLALVQQMQAMQQQIRELALARQASPATPQALGDQVGALGTIAGVFKDLAGITGGPAAAKASGLTPEDALKLIDVGKALAGGKIDSFAHKALEMFGPAGVDVLKTSAALMMFKLTGDQTAKKEEAPAAADDTKTEGQGT